MDLREVIASAKLKQFPEECNPVTLPLIFTLQMLEMSSRLV